MTILLTDVVFERSLYDSPPEREFLLLVVVYGSVWSTREEVHLELLALQRKVLQFLLSPASVISA